MDNEKSQSDTKMMRITGRKSGFEKVIFAIILLSFLTLVMKLINAVTWPKMSAEDNGLAVRESSEEAESVAESQGKVTECLQASWNEQQNSSASSKIFVITPTFKRPEQTAELTRLAQTLSQVENLHWIVGIDSESCDKSVETTLARSLSRTKFNAKLTVLTAPMPAFFRKLRARRKFGLPRGVAARRAALDWILSHTNDPEKQEQSVIYFADDDNAYDLRLFDEIRKTRKMSMFPVAFLRPSSVRGPLLNQQGRVFGFVGARRPFRRYPVDMAGFAFTLSLLREKRPIMPFRATFEEEGFLRSMNIKYSDIEPLANNCTEILVWHTMTAVPEPQTFSVPRTSEISNLKGLFKTMVEQGIIAENGHDDRNVKEIELCIGHECYQ